MPRGRPKNLENRTAHEEIVLFLQWAEQHELDNIPVVAALGTAPTTPRIHDAIQWADQRGFIRIAAALRERALPGH